MFIQLLFVFKSGLKCTWFFWLWMKRCMVWGRWSAGCYTRRRQGWARSWAAGWRTSACPGWDSSTWTSTCPCRVCWSAPPDCRPEYGDTLLRAYTRFFPGGGVRFKKILLYARFGKITPPPGTFLWKWNKDEKILILMCFWLTCHTNVRILVRIVYRK